MTVKADIAIIGTGPGGYVAALRASQLGAKVVCIEKKWVGGVCLNEGCIPTKALLRSAEVFSLVRHAATFGVEVEEPKINWPAVQARKEKVVRQMVGGVVKLLERAGVQTMMGAATFLRPDTLKVVTPNGEEHVVADNILIATGSRTMQVPIPGLDGPSVIDHSGIMALQALPASLCVIGGGAIGLEYASLMVELGVKVTVVEMLPRLAPLMDASIGQGLAWSLGNRGVEILTGTKVTSVKAGANGAMVTVTTPEGERQIEAEKVLSAIGRAPNTEGIGLEVLGLNATRKGIAVDDRMRTAVPHVYAIGDVAAEGPMLAHVASHQGVVAVEDALGLTAHMNYAAVPSCIFTLPEAAGVGMTEEQAKEAGYEVLVGTFALPNNGKAVAYGDTDGFVTVVSESKHHAVLGMHIVGPHASDLILEGTLAIEMEATLDEIEHTIHAHPTLGESNAEAALAAMGRALHLPARK
ncbi:MAG: dihydrolipoyl dehydrogenase [Chloroflexi bacterium]|nr:dihydrolipoyl dehydrogenase [Chloroflexota bacterium]